MKKVTKLRNKTVQLYRHRVTNSNCMRKKITVIVKVRKFYSIVAFFKQLNLENKMSMNC